MALAEHVSQWSKDPSTKVGAVIVNDRRIVVAIGYNGFPRGVSDDPERYADRPTKYSFVVHAEMNAILNATEDVRGCTLYVTLAPCNECTKLVVQSGIGTIVTPPRNEAYAELHGARASEAMLAEAGVNHIVLREFTAPVIHAPIGGLA